MYMFVQERAFNIEKSVVLPIGRVFSLLTFKVNLDEFLETNYPAFSRYSLIKILYSISIALIF